MRYSIYLTIISIVVGFTFHAVTPDFPMRGDTQTFYDPIAKNLAQGTGFWLNGEPTARVAPAYPFILSLIYRLGGGFNEMLILQIFILAGIAVFGYLIANRIISSRKFAFLAALNIALWPYLLLYSKLALTETLFVFLLVAAIHALTVFSQTPSVKNAVLAGSIMGFATLTRPLILFLPLYIIGLATLAAIIFRRNDILRESKKWALALAIFFLVLAPWTARNFIQFDKLIPITSGLSASLNRAYVTLDYTEGTPALSPEKATIFDHVISRAKNIYLFWNPGTNGSNADLLSEKNSLFNLAFLLYKIIFILTVSLSAFAFIISKLHRRQTVLLLGFVILYFWIIHTILYPYPRYTLPIMPSVIILAWASIYYIYNEYTSWRKTH